MKKTIVVLACLLVPAVCPAEENRAFLKNGHIMVQTNAEIRSLDYSRDDQYTPSYDLEKWRIREQPSRTEEALKVYHKKARPLYTRRYWIIDKNDETRRVFVEYTSHDRRQRILFTSDEKYAYYVDICPEGNGLLTGVDLLSGQTFVIAPAASFFMSTCPDKTSYIVVRDTSAEDLHQYMVYTAEGDLVNTVVHQETPETINQLICP